jgi:hypothetical protein
MCHGHTQVFIDQEVQKVRKKQLPVYLPEDGVVEGKNHKLEVKDCEYHLGFLQALALCPQLPSSAVPTKIFKKQLFTRKKTKSLQRSWRDYCNAYTHGPHDLPTFLPNPQGN